jgi:hypothetical protein
VAAFTEILLFPYLENNTSSSFFSLLISTSR